MSPRVHQLISEANTYISIASVMGIAACVWYLATMNSKIDQLYPLILDVQSLKTDVSILKDHDIIRGMLDEKFDIEIK